MQQTNISTKIYKVYQIDHNCMLNDFRKYIRLDVLSPKMTVVLALRLQATMVYRIGDSVIRRNMYQTDPGI